MFKKYLISSLILVLIAWASYMILPAYQGYSDARQKLHEIDKKLLQQQKDNEVLRVTNQKLKSDSRAIERVAREKFGWSKSGEKIYDFSN